MFRLKRILEVNGRFIPQTRDSIFSSWKSKGKKSEYIWFTEEYQIEYCSYNTLGEAKESIQKIKPIRKIHKV